jgi:hypothetical protein
MRGGISNVFGNFEETKNVKQNTKIAKPSIIHFRRTPAVIRKANSAPAVIRKANSAPAVIRSHTKSAEGQYETNKLLLDLSQRISLGITKDRNGNKISPTVPPKYITYQMLYDECLDNRQIPRITKEEKDKLKKTFKNDEKYPLLNNSIGAKILLNESLYELERVKWWCDWYKMTKGRYSSGLSQLSSLSGRVRSTSLRKAKTYGGVSGAGSVGGTGARRFSPSMTSRERQERQNEERIQRQYRLLIPIRNGLLYAMRCFGNVAYSAATFLYWTTSLIMDSDDIDVIHDTNEEVRQEYARRQAHASEENARRQTQAQYEDNARRHAHAQEDIRRQRQEQYERTQRPPEYYERKFANLQRNVREKSKETRSQHDEKIKKNIFEKEVDDLQKRREQAEADRIKYQEIMYIMREIFENRRAFTQQNYDDAAQERRRRKQAGIRIPWDTAQSPPRAATRATQAPQAAQAPSAMSQGLPAMNDDLNLGTLEEWKIISESGMRWSDIKGIQSIIGNNNNTIASVMLFLYLRNNLKDADAISKLTKGHFGNQSIDALIADFKRHIFNNAYASIGEDFFKIKDAGSKVYSISRMTLLGQRLNRVFFFLARNHKCNYVGYKRTRGEGYDFANEIGLTDEGFKDIMVKSGADIPDEIKKLHKSMLRKYHSDKKNNIPTKTFTVEVELLDGTVVQREREVVDTNDSDRDYPMKRYNEIYTEFKKWYDWYKKDPSSYLKQERQYFKPVENEIDWDNYDNGILHDIRHKEWFGI